MSILTISILWFCTILGIRQAARFYLGSGRAAQLPPYVPAIVPTATTVFNPNSRTDQLLSLFAQDRNLFNPRPSVADRGRKNLSTVPSSRAFNIEPSVRLLWTPSGHQITLGSSDARREDAVG